MTLSCAEVGSTFDWPHRCGPVLTTAIANTQQYLGPYTKPLEYWHILPLVSGRSFCVDLSGVGVQVRLALAQHLLIELRCRVGAFDMWRHHSRRFLCSPTPGSGKGAGPAVVIAAAASMTAGRVHTASASKATLESGWEASSIILEGPLGSTKGFS